eukprot:TRINITY_DN1820_c2_g1_i1.p1 TRINITY_DN1820_c2_g1~~TRINITY_DN1820_c2_g1_i1.p1  ORF type:complete len:476 (+),score=108.48 TRINITY_DN1820_c2_g1_i1:73-1500(+)
MAKGNWSKPATAGKATSAGAAVKALKKRVTGTVTEWKGTYGWIAPSQPIDHPSAGKTKGRIYVHQEDVEEPMKVGASVSFFVFSDNKGLGAKHVRAAGLQGPQGRGGAAVPAGKPNGQASQDRQRIGKTRLTGKVTEWRGNFGWIMPSSKVDHPDAAKKQGKIYFTQADVDLELGGVGSTVDFFLYKDPSGLGAMHVRPAKQTGKKAEPKKLVKKKLKTPDSKKEHKLGAAPDKSKRTSLSSDSLAGTVVSKRGEMVAFIKPDVEIDHPKFKESVRQDLYLHKDDVDEGDFPNTGATVLFFLYEDDKGLGAERCQVLEQGDGTLPEHLKEEMKKRLKESKKTKTKKDSSQGGSKASKTVQSGAFAKKQAKKQQEKKKKNKKQGTSEQKEKGPSGPDLPRERIMQEMITGEVISWNKTFAWLKPTEPVAHGAAEKNGGKIYLHKKDITEGTTMEKGATVSFYLYADSSGLGAEECC